MSVQNRIAKLFLTAISGVVVFSGPAVFAQATSEFKTIHEQTQIKQDLNSEKNSNQNADGSGNSNEKTRVQVDLNSTRDEKSFSASGDEATADENGARGTVREKSQPTPYEVPSPKSQEQQLPNAFDGQNNGPGLLNVPGSQQGTPLPESSPGTLKPNLPQVQPQGLEGVFSPIPQR